jgi:alpha-glucosidase
VAVFPDWFHSNTQQYWNDEFASFFNADSGVDIDALWIDMNEPSNFCDYPCDDPEAKTEQDAANLKTIDAPPKSTPGTEKVRRGEDVTHSPRKKKPIRVNDRAAVASRGVAERQTGGDKKGLPGRDLINPSYEIQNELGSLSNRTANTDLIHQGGWAEYDTHNL